MSANRSVDPIEHSKLMTISNSFDPTRRKRALVILSYLKGLPISEVASSSEYSGHHVRKVIKNYNRYGLSSLEGDEALDSLSDDSVRAFVGRRLDDRAETALRAFLKPKYPDFFLANNFIEGVTVRRRPYYCRTCRHSLYYWLAVRREKQPQYTYPYRKCPICESHNVTSKPLDYFKTIRDTTRFEADYSESGSPMNKFDVYLMFRNAKRRAFDAGVLCDITKTDIEDCLSHFGYACCYCGRTSDLTIDHAIPISEQGGTERKNILISCQQCNTSRRNTSVDDWYPTHPFFTEERLGCIKSWLSG